MFHGGLFGEEEPTETVDPLSATWDAASGLGDGVVRSITEATGAAEFAESEQAEELRRERARAREEGGISGAFREFDVATRAGVDFLLDNPRASYQDTQREGIELVTGVESEEQGEAAAELGSQFSEAASSLTADTPLDNPVTDAVSTGFEWLIADPAKAGITAATGIDVDEGTTEGTVGAVDAFDIGVTVGTLGAGKAGLGAARVAARSSDEAGGVLARLLGRSVDDIDEPVQLVDDASRALDETAGTADNLPVLADEAAQSADNLPVLADEVAQSAETLPVLADEAVQLGDDLFGVTSIAARGTARASELASGTGGFISRIGSRLSDEFTRLSDEFASGGDEAAALSDEVAQSIDEAAQITDESPGLLSRITGSRAATFGVATGGVVAGGALLEALGTFDRVEVTDEQGNAYLLINEKRYRPTETRPDGGVLWRVDQTGGSSLGYTVMVGVQGRNVYILDREGNRIRAKVDAEQFNEAIQRARGAA